MTRLASLEWALSLAFTATAVSLLAIQTSQAGGLWRDECGSVQLARMSSWTEIWEKFTFEAFPLLFPASLRCFTEVFGVSDSALRAYGLVTGLLLVLALWWNSWLLRRQPPLLGLAILGLNANVLIWGTTVRGYGPASVMIVVTFGLLAQVLRSPGPGWIAAALGAALTSVQLALHNCFLLLALVLAATCAAMLERKRREAIVLFGIGAVCAASMLMYVPRYTHVTWNRMVRREVSVGELCAWLVNAAASPSRIMLLIWGGLGLLALLGIAIRFARPQDSSTDERMLGRYGLLSAVLAPACYLFFLKLVSYSQAVWYYIILLCLMGSVLDFLIAVLATSERARQARALLVLCLLLFLPGRLWPLLPMRLSNMRQIADQVTQAAAPEDLILVNPWCLGVGFNWYYHGPAQWRSVPPLADLRVHRYDLLEARMTAAEPLRDLPVEIERTLNAGHRIWLVGNYDDAPSEPRFILSPAPDPVQGWSEAAYQRSWTEQLKAILQAKQVDLQPVDLADSGGAPALEQAALWVGSRSPSEKTAD